jgi:hypothetical protein
MVDFNFFILYTTCKDPYNILFYVIVEWCTVVQVSVVWCEEHGVVYVFIENNFVTETKYLIQEQTDTHMHIHILTDKQTHTHTHIMSDSS